MVWCAFLIVNFCRFKVIAKEPSHFVTLKPSRNKWKCVSNTHHSLRTIGSLECCWVRNQKKQKKRTNQTCCLLSMKNPLYISHVKNAFRCSNYDFVCWLFVTFWNGKGINSIVVPVFRICHIFCIYMIWMCHVWV